MTLESYIKDLLYRYDCVIVPNFGGFITNRIGARLDKNSNNFYPPLKQITFNSHLKINDGLLANYIVSAENVSYDAALENINKLVSNWKNQLKNGVLEINDLGILKLNDSNKIIFEPNAKVNYLTEAFGLASYQVSPIQEEKAANVIPLQPVTKEETKRKGIPTFIKYAATAAILLSLGFAGFNGYQDYQNQQILVEQEKALEKKIQSATFVISDPLPAIKLNVVKEKEKYFHVVAGAFQFPENAKKKVAQLKKKGFDASILGVNKWGLTEVAFASYADRNDAINNLYKIQDTISEDAWLLVKK